ncbi:MAG: SBBP repeat-containing protein [Gammaproteobacteria bacterium]
MAKLNRAGSKLVYSTYLGGTTGDTLGTGIAVDHSGQAYVTGSTFSADFPTQNPLQPALSGTADAFVTKIGP